jgi:hypothetical protein
MKKYFLLFLLFFCYTYLNAQPQNISLDILSDQIAIEDSLKGINEKSPLLAFGLSYLFPGLGQFYNGEIGKGFLFLGGITAGIGIMFIGNPGADFEATERDEAFIYSGLGIAGLIYIWQLIDAPVSASRINYENRMKIIGHKTDIGISLNINILKGTVKIFF